VLVAVDVDPDLAAIGHHLGDVDRVERRDRGCDLAQGYWLGYPMNDIEFAQLLISKPKA
jgi:hypothetical protein